MNSEFTRVNSRQRFTSSCIKHLLVAHDSVSVTNLSRLLICQENVAMQLCPFWWPGTNIFQFHLSFADVTTRNVYHKPVMPFTVLGVVTTGGIGICNINIRRIERFLVIVTKPKLACVASISERVFERAKIGVAFAPISRRQKAKDAPNRRKNLRKRLLRRLNQSCVFHIISSCPSP